MSVASVISNAASRITGAISQAARSTGISFEYLVTTAQIESRLNPKAQAPTSTASGLYQFIDQTWLGTLKKDGPSLGLGQYAAAISQGADGRYTVDNPDMRKAILQLRHDPRASAMMAGAFTRNNENQLASVIGRQPTEGELYIAHFLGSGGAGKLIENAINNPEANAAQMFPSAASANHSVFYDRQGQARSVAGVYGELTRRYQVARNTAFNLGLLRGSIDPLTGRTAQNASALASAPQAIAQGPGGPQAFAAIRGSMPKVPDPAGITQAIAAAGQGTPQRAASGSVPLFQAMFSDRGPEPVTPAVQRLWATTRSAQISEQQAQAAAASGQLNTLDLFVDHPRDPRALFGNEKA
ncbi:MAG TPA: transglycosylase SLT domain-containing protein [Pseudolabrys sp.]|nr:transglycosylase SLT domain-containing protein [Pseudolabrys sp.]